MSRIVKDYLNHTLVSAPEVQQRYDQPALENPTGVQRIIHIAQTALPLVSLCKPLGKPITLATGGYKTVAHLSFSFQAFRQGHYKEGSKQLLQTALAATLVASTFFEFKIGLFFTNVNDVFSGVYALAECIGRGQYSKAAKESLQVFVSLLYISFMMTGTLEYLLAMYAIQAVISLCQCREEFSAGRFPEALLCFALALVRVKQTQGCYEQIQMRDALISLERYQRLFDRALKGRVVREMLTHELAEMDKSIEENRVVFKNSEGKEFDFGSHFHEYGKELVKGDNLELRKIEVNGKTVYELDFKINAVFRRHFENLVTDYKTMDSKSISAVLDAAHSNATGITVTEKQYPMGQMNLGKAHHISVDGLGKVIVGNGGEWGSNDFPGLAHRVIVQMDSTKNLFQMHELLSLVGLERALEHSSVADIDRLKIGHLYRVFFPREATPFERTDEFFTLSLDELKAKIVKTVPEMKGILDKYLKRMDKEEILPGKVRYKIDGLGDELKKNGAIALTAAITGPSDNKTLFSRVEAIMTMGMTSNETRASHGVVTPGVSVEADFETGAADSVFMQLLTKGHTQYDFNYLEYWSKVRVMIDVKALEMGTYQYHSDSYGTRQFFDNWGWGGGYRERPGIVEFVQGQNRKPTYSNEVMFKERVAPKFVKGFVVDNQTTKVGLQDHLRKVGLVTVKGGVEYVNDIPLTHFVTTEKKIGTWYQKFKPFGV